MENLYDDIQKYIQNGEINLPEEIWNKYNDLYGKDTIIDCLKEYVLSGKIELPLRKLSLQDARQSFEDLMSYQCNPLKSGRITTRYDYEFDNFSDKQCLYIEESNIGNIASDYFQQYNRFCCNSINSPSPVRTWNNEKFLSSALKALWTLKCKSVNTNTLRTCLALRKYIASQFKPAVAKSIYERFNSQDILDFSAGWGDRLCGFYACSNTKSYIGIDPNTAVQNGYKRQIELYSEYGVKQTTLINKPAEEVVLPANCVDTVFTSPPYFNIERYSNEPTQSFKRYKKLEDWLEQFLFKSLDMASIALKENGYMLINISDVYSNHQINKICDPMNYHLEKSGLTYIGCIGMKMAKRPNSRTIGDGVFVEPIWVWQKR